MSESVGVHAGADTMLSWPRAFSYTGVASLSSFTMACVHCWSWQTLKVGQFYKSFGSSWRHPQQLSPPQLEASLAVLSGNLTWNWSSDKRSISHHPVLRSDDQHLIGKPPPWSALSEIPFSHLPQLAGPQKNCGLGCCSIPISSLVQPCTKAGIIMH